MFDAFQDQPQWQPVPFFDARGALDKKERFNNIRRNCASPIHRLEPMKPHNRPCVLLCYGPSLKKTYREAIEESRLSGAAIVTTSGAHDFMTERGMPPHFHVEFDPRQERAKFTKQPNESTLYLMASRCHPDLRKRLIGYKAAMWHGMDNGEHDLIEKCEKKRDVLLIPGGACVGLRAITVMYTLGFRFFSIYGFDCSFDSEGEWAAGHPGKPQGEANHIQVRCGGRVFTTATIYTIYARQFFETIWRLEDADFTLHGDGLLQELAKQREIYHSKKEKAA